MKNFCYNYSYCLLTIDSVKSTLLNNNLQKKPSYFYFWSYMNIQIIFYVRTKLFSP